jgi:alkaline phosphatase D
MFNAVASPLISYASSRPSLTHGLQSGDVTHDGAVIWARTDRPARMLVDASTSDTFQIIRASAAVDAFPETDFTAKVALDGLPAGREIFYRIRFQDHATPTILSEPQTGSFRTAPLEPRTLSFIWSGDTAGQGFGIDIDRGGMRTFSTMLKHEPDFFIHSGDSIYADCEIPSQLTLKDGGIWRNLVTEEKSKVAETLAEFRGNYKYNLLDTNVRAFNAHVPSFAQWDDHEVTNDWVPGESVTWHRYTEKSILALTARGGRAFHEFMPTRQAVTEAGRVYRKIAYGPLLDIFMIDMRSYRTPLKLGDESEILGARQLSWLKRELMNSRATWKVIAADLPIGLVSDDAVALGDGPPAAREHEIAGLLSFIKHGGISNVVWLTADMHYTAAHYYDPNKAVFQDFEPFWEFVSGPLHAGTWSPGQLDNTFGPTAMFAKGAGAEQGDCLAPCYGLQFFGHVTIDGESEAMTVTLRDVDDHALWQTTIEPKQQRTRRQKLARG